MIPPVGAMIQPVDPNKGLSQLSSILGVRQAQQNLQTGAINQQNAQALLQQHQQDTQQRQAAANFFQNYDVGAHVGEDGTLDLDQALTNPALKATGDAYPAIAQQLIGMKNSQLDAKTKLAALNGELRQQFYENVGGLSNDPDVKGAKATGTGKVLDAIDQFGETGGPDAQRVAAVFRPLVQNLIATGKTDKLPEMLSNWQLQALHALPQREQTYGTPTTVETGGAVVPGVQAPAAAGGAFTPSGAPVSKTLPPGLSIVYDANKNPFYLNTQTNTLTPVGTGRPGGVPATAAAPGAAPASNVPTNIPTVINGITRPSNLPPELGIPAAPAGAAQPGAGQPAPGPQSASPRMAPPPQPAPSTIGPAGFVRNVPGQDQIVSDIANTRTADADYGLNKHINDRILTLSANTNTGPGTERWHDVLGAIAGPLGGNNVSDFQTVSAYLDRQAAMAAKQMGLPDTNAGLETARGLSGTTEYQPAALQEKTKLTDALVEGAHQFRQGLDKVVGTGPVQDLSRYQQYRNAWAANFTPDVYLYENARARGDKEGAAKIVSNMSQQQAADLQRKRRNLAMLADGKIPQ